MFRTARVIGDGEFARSWALPSTADGVVDVPWGVSIDSNDDVWVATTFGRCAVLMAGDNTKGHPAGTKGSFDEKGNKVRQARRFGLHPIGFALLERVRGRERQASIRAEALM